ncbi:pyruvate kinase [Oceanirhabdus sp. W0125-5]|uniref:pyruvate kinase n=1 Tax=Oceanirhabdus sp. W0125-5 TaxID=2999116 RepID=UPI0022F30519|nr:pyruvate kinase [Oceanirhabdus sp. W0125-5]WBW99304.1 pyruvate kinase [Oceanirhabdus sp. W0125-5]
MKRTKIVCTIGPASNNKETLTEMMKAGMNVSRHNFSHGSHEEHTGNMNLVKEVRESLGKHVAILLDTKGPEIRTGEFAKEVELIEGSKFVIYCGEEVIGDETKCNVTYEELYKDVKEGDKILIDDGLVGLTVESIEDNKIHCVVLNNGLVSTKKGVNVPGVAINLPALTEKDIADLKFGITMGIDYVAASFVRKASDVVAIRKVLTENGGDHIQIISKIENREGVDNIDKIIKLSDGIMVARGDLGVEIPTEEVPLAQKMMIKKCNEAGKPVITATQMLDSMIRNPRPTRAEASDVANAIFDGTDAIMLSGETAKGRYAVEAVKTMANIAITAENSVKEDALDERSHSKIASIPDAISIAVCTSAAALKAKAVITATQSGQTANNVSKYRPNCTILAVTPYDDVARRLALRWGIYPIVAEKKDSTDEMIDSSVEIAVEKGHLTKGDLVVIAAGIPMNYAGSTNMMKVHIVGDVLVTGKGIVKKSGYGSVKIVKNVDEAQDVIFEGDVLVCKTLDNSYLSVLDKVSAIVVEDDQVSSSVVIECTAKEIPIIANACEAAKILKQGSFVTVEGERGIVISGKAE